MEFLTDWVMQIITFIFIGIIAHMLLPSNTYKKYVQMVIGLLMLFIFLKPIMLLLQFDITKELEGIHHGLLQEIPDINEASFENTAIENERDAYIWNEVKKRMMTEANEALIEEKTEILDMQFIFDEASNEMQLIHVLLHKNESSHSSTIQPVSIKIHHPSSADQSLSHRQKDQAIIKKLTSVWQMDESYVQVEWMETKEEDK